MTKRQERWFRLRASGLVTPLQSSCEVASKLVGVQAQILPAAGIALMNRTEGLSDAQFQAALWTDKTLVKLWSQRGTLHVFPVSDWPLVIGALSAQRSWFARKLERTGGDVSQFNQTVAAVTALMHEQGTLCRSELRASGLPLNDRLLSSWGGIFHELVRRGDACHAPRRGGEGVFAHRLHWAPELVWSPPSAEAANQEFARRYFQTYGPSTLHDFAYWRGVTLRAARPWVEAIADELVEVQVASESKWIHRDCSASLRESAPSAEDWPLLMLYRFDPLLLGHRDKTWLVPKRFYDRVWRKAGHIEGTILQEGKIISTWRYQRQASALTVAVEPFAELSEALEDEIMDKAVGIADYFGTTCTEVEFISS